MLFAYLVAVLLAGVVVAFQSRVVAMSEFRERVQLSAATYNVAFFLLVLVPVVVMFRQERESVYAIRSGWFRLACRAEC